MLIQPVFSVLALSRLEINVPHMPCKLVTLAINVVLQAITADTPGNIWDLQTFVWQ